MIQGYVEEARKVARRGFNGLRLLCHKCHNETSD
jgi:hypothetical protein